MLLTVKGHGATYTEKVTFIVKDIAAQEDDETYQEEESDPNCIVLKLSFSDPEPREESTLDEQAPRRFEEQGNETVA